MGGGECRGGAGKTTPRFVGTGLRAGFRHQAAYCFVLYKNISLSHWQWASSLEKVATSGHPGRSGVTYRVHQGLRIKQIISDTGEASAKAQGLEDAQCGGSHRGQWSQVRPGHTDTCRLQLFLGGTCVG